MKKWMVTIISFCSISAFGQNNGGPQLEKVLPLSPNAAAFQKFGDIPVGYYTGIPNISVPLYTIKSGSLELPISLSYHAGGVKVDDIASWVGLGWSLSAGGSINSQMRGKADAGGFLNGAVDWVTDFNNLNLTARYNHYLDIKSGIKDGQPDLFSLSIAGESFKFYYNNQNEFVTKPRNKAKIEFGIYYGFQGWKVVPASGIQYFFLTHEESNSFGGAFPGSASSDDATGITSWHITKIISADGTDEINFEYENATQIFITSRSSTQYFYTPGAPTLPGGKVQSFNYSTSNTAVPFIKKIIFSDGEIVFNKKSTTREDIEGNSKALDNIELKNKAGTIIQKIVLHTGYVESQTQGDATFTNGPELAKRLYLDSLSIFNGTLTEKQLYRFDYNNRIYLPKRLSSKQDLWGYYNGSTNNTPCTQPPKSFLWGATPTEFVYNGADRNPNEQTITYGTMNAITYPTGGRSEFLYESNTIGNYLDLRQDQTNSLHRGFDFRDEVNFLGITGNPNQTYYTASINVTKEFGYQTGRCLAKLKIGLPGNDNIPPSTATPDDPIIKITYPNGSFEYLRNHKENWSLPLGVSTITVDFTNANQALIPNFYLHVEYEYGLSNNPQKNTNVKWGGIRLKQQTNYDGLGAIANTKTYKYGDNLTSWGHSYSIPVLIDFSQGVGIFNGNDCDTLNENSIISQITFFKTLNSVSQTSATMQQGSWVGYNKVEEWFNTHDNEGKNVYEYNQFPDDTYNAFPYPPANNLDELRGNLIRSSTYKKLGNIYKLQKEKISNYNFPTSINNIHNMDGFTQTKGLVVKQFAFTSGSEESMLISCKKQSYKYYQYNTQSVWVKLLSEETKTYDENNNYISSVTNYDYSPLNMQPNQITTTNSKGQTLVSRTWYPLDYNNVGFNIADLKTRNLLNLPIRKESWVNGNVNNGNIILYNQFGKPTDIMSYENSQLIASITHNPNNVILSNYQSKITIQYDALNNLRQQQKANDIPECYIWGYGGQYPVAKIVGTTWALANAVFNTADLAEINNPSSDIALRTVLQKLRTNLSNVFVSTYTYSPLIGITSETDPNNKTTYYEYDSFNRLKLIRDFNNNILKTFDYKYKQ